MTAIAETTSTLCFQALPADDLRRIRTTGVDDFGHAVRVSVNDAEGEAPLRCCLREARVGERIALIAWRPLVDTPDSVWAEVGPLYVHADECPGHHDDGTYPEGFRHRKQILRSYTAAGDVHDMTITDGQTAETAILALLADPSAAVVHSRNIVAGCYMFAIRRR